MLLLLFFLLGTFSQLTSAQDAAFTAIDVRKSIKIATTILELSAKLEASDEAPSEEQFLTLLANALESEHNEGQPINRDIFNLHPKEKTAIQSVDGGAMFLALSKNTKFDDLKNDPALQKELNDLIAKQKEEEAKDELLDLEEKNRKRQENAAGSHLTNSLNSDDISQIHFIFF